MRADHLPTPPAPHDYHTAAVDDLDTPPEFADDLDDLDQYGPPARCEPTPIIEAQPLRYLRCAASALRSRDAASASLYLEQAEDAQRRKTLLHLASLPDDPPDDPPPPPRQYQRRPGPLTDAQLFHYARRVTYFFVRAAESTEEQGRRLAFCLAVQDSPEMLREIYTRGRRL